jgi:hypothetical protein
VPCGDIWVDGLVCNILSYCHLADSRPQQALEVQQRVSGVSVANRNLFVTVYRAFVMAQSYLRQGISPKRNVRPRGRCAMRSSIPARTPAAALPWRPFSPRSPGAGEGRAGAKPAGSASGDHRQLLPMALAAATSSWPARPEKRGGSWRPIATACRRAGGPARLAAGAGSAAGGADRRCPSRGRQTGRRRAAASPADP